MDYSTILSPNFLVENMELIGQIISVMILLIFDDFFTSKIAFGWTDALKRFMLEKEKEKFKKRYRFIIKYTFEFLATILFIAYFFMGYWVLSEYVIVPILQRAQAILLIIIIGFFLLTSWLLNNTKARRKYLGYK
jgi:hypothetical protein